MKAFLLAAGLGTRLRPLTDRIPKCLVPIAGKPLLQIWLEQLVESGFDEVLVNTHHLADQVERHVQEHPVPGIKVELFHEEVLLGSAGTVRENAAFVRGEKRFVIIYADNLTRLNLAELVAFHDTKAGSLTMALFRTPNPSECGIVVCDEQQQVVEFQEKPAHPKSDWANAGIYVVGQDLFEQIPRGKPITDFGFDVLPNWTGTMYGYPYEGFYCDTGTPQRLQYARDHWTV